MRCPRPERTSTATSTAGSAVSSGPSGGRKAAVPLAQASSPTQPDGTTTNASASVPNASARSEAIVSSRRESAHPAQAAASRQAMAAAASSGRP